MSKAHKFGDRVELRTPSGLGHSKGNHMTAVLIIEEGARGMIVGLAGTHGVVQFDALGGTVAINLPLSWLRVCEQKRERS